MILAYGSRGRWFNSRLSPVLTLNCWINDTPQGASNHLPAGENWNWENQAWKETSTQEGTIFSGKNESKTLIFYRKSRSGVRWADVLAYASSSRREKSRDQFMSIPDLTLLEVELLIIYRVSQKLASPQDLHSNAPNREELSSRARTISW